MTVWERRDRPLLEVLARGVPDRRVALGRDRGTALGLDLDDEELFAGMLTLLDAGFVAADMREETSAGVVFTNVLVTGPGMQALGQWPLFEEITSPSTLAAFLHRWPTRLLIPTKLLSCKTLGATFARSVARSFAQRRGPH